MTNLLFRQSMTAAQRQIFIAQHKARAYHNDAFAVVGRTDLDEDFRNKVATSYQRLAAQAAARQMQLRGIA